MGGLLYASEAWVLSILGWTWLTVQEVWGFALLNSFVYYGMLFLSTCNVVLVGCFPNMRAIKAAYLSAVLVLLITSLGCIFDTLETAALGSGRFELPLGATGSTGSNATQTCTFARANRAFFFNSSSPLYLAQAGVILGYLLVHLFVAAAGMMAVRTEGEEMGTVWPGPAWGLALVALVAFRYFIMFDGSIKGAAASGIAQSGTARRFRYLHLFSEPMWEFTSAFLVFFELAVVLLALEGFPMPSLGQRKFVRFFVMGFAPVFVIGASVALSFRGMLTIPALLTLLLALPPAVAGTVEAAAARPAPLAADPDAPSAPPEHLVTGRSIYNKPGARSQRHYIPVPVEMIGEKSKAV
jgi:hypothetical protein